MELDVAQVLLQAPIVGIFAWFVWKNNQEWRKFLEARNSKTEKAFQQLTDSLERINRNQDRHTRVLIKHFTQHGERDVDDLIDN